MKKILALSALTAVVAVPGAALLMTPADAAQTTVQVRQSDFIPTLSDTRANGKLDFLREGVRVTTTADTAAAGQPSNNKAAEYFPLTGGIPASGAYDWYGTVNQPGAQIVFDLDSDRTNANSFNVLVGEQVYSTNAPGQPLTDWWYTGGSARALQRGITCPSTTTTSGSDCHGTLTQWKTALPAAQAYAGGFSLGSGVVGDGVLRATSFGDTTYEYTDQAAATTAPTATTSPTSTATATATATATSTPKVGTTVGTVKAVGVKRYVRIKFTTAALAPGTVEGAKITYKVKVDGKTTFTTSLGSAEKSTARARFAARSGKHVVTIFQDNALVKTVKVRA